jgi:anaerobic sulfite reductase subunit A
MVPTSEYSALMSNRENMYRFLGRLYRIEVDQVLLDQLKGMHFPQNAVISNLMQDTGC